MNAFDTSPAPADPIAAVTHRDPSAFYDALLRGPELVYDERLRLWIAAKASVVEQVLNDPRLRVRPVHEPVPAAIEGGSAGEVFARLVRMNEGPAHDTPKLALHRALAALDLAEVALTTKMLAARAMPGSAKDLSAWTFELPVSVVASALGFGDAQLAGIARGVGDFVACLSPLSSPEQIAASHRAAASLVEDMKQLLVQAPPHTLAGLVAAQAEALGWVRADAIVANLVGLMSQTCEATAALIGNAVVALLRRPELRRAVAAGDIAAFVDDVARRDPAVHNTRRFAAEDIEMAGCTIRQGEAVLVVLAAANRDGERQFGFGHGRHACPGQAMAGAIASAAIGQLMALAPSLLDQRLEWSYRPSANARIPVFTSQGPAA